MLFLMDIKSISEKSVCVNPFCAHGKSKAEDKHIQKNLDTSSKTRKKYVRFLSNCVLHLY